MCPLIFFPSIKYERSLQQNCPGWFSSLLKSASNLLKCLGWDLQETGFWTHQKDKQYPRLGTVPRYVSFWELSFLINVVSAERACVPGHCQHWWLMRPWPLIWKVPWASVSLSIFFYQQEQGHFQSHTGSKSNPWAALLAGSKDSWFRASFINFSMIDPWGWIILYFGGSSVPCRMFSSIPTLCPLDVWAPLVTTTSVSRYYQVVPKGAKITPG